VKTFFVDTSFTSGHIRKPEIIICQFRPKILVNTFLETHLSLAVSYIWASEKIFGRILFAPPNIVVGAEDAAVSPSKDFVEEN